MLFYNEMPPKKIRNFSICFHNVKNDPSPKPFVDKIFDSKNPDKYTSGLEPNPEENGEGFHFHVFVFFKSAHHFTAILKLCKEISTKITAPKPEGEERDWGRVQVDPCYGTFQDCVNYLTNPKKDKVCDPNPTVYEAPPAPPKGCTPCDLCGTIVNLMSPGSRSSSDGSRRCEWCHLTRRPEFNAPPPPNVKLYPISRFDEDSELYKSLKDLISIYK